MPYKCEYKKIIDYTASYFNKGKKEHFISSFQMRIIYYLDPEFQGKPDSQTLLVDHLFGFHPDAAP